MTRPLIGTSWKMNHTSTDAAAWFAAARPLLEPLTADIDLFVLPPFPAIWVARQSLAGSAIGWGGQDVHPDERGAHTGDVSAPMLVDLGCRYVEVGHSERRRDHGETDDLVAAKVRTAVRWKLAPVVCVGEREQGAVDVAWRIVERQIARAFADLDPAGLDRVVVAYEPVWAIGEGAAAADPEHVSSVQVAIGRWLAERGARISRVIYGGSVDETSASGLLASPGVDGLFVGRAALDPGRFAAIARAAMPAVDSPIASLERSA